MLTTAYYALASLAARVERYRPFGRSIFDSEWDICVVLDSTRLDMLRTVWSRNEPVDSAWSRGSITTEWLANTFRPEQAEAISETAYVTASPHSHTVFRKREVLTNASEVDFPFPDGDVVAPGEFAGFHEVWRSHATEHGAVPPETMLDATLEAADRYDRVVAHWLQPHEPFIAGASSTIGGGATEQNVWDALNKGEADKEAVWNSYTANLIYALAGVELLVENTDARVLLTSDHGNGFGEWGIYGHPFAWPQPEVRKVPWVEMEATDSETYTYSPVLDSTRGDEAIDDQLRALGYR